MNLGKDELLSLLDAFKKELRTFDRTTSRQDRWVRWHNEVRATLRKVFGDESPESKGYRGASSWGRPIAGFSKEDIQAQEEEQFEEVLTTIRGWLDALIFQVEKFGLETHSESPGPAYAAKVFIAHGSSSNALSLLIDFLLALGCQPVIAEKMPSEDRSVDDNVTYWMEQSDCAVVLATGEELASDQIVARPNVHIEIGRFQERFAGRIVYLLEEGADFPSNIAEKVRERFTQDNMTKAFIKIANEFRAFGILVSTASD